MLELFGIAKNLSLSLKQRNPFLLALSLAGTVYLKVPNMAIGPAPDAAPAAALAPAAAQALALALAPAIVRKFKRVGAGRQILSQTFWRQCPS